MKWALPRSSSWSAVRASTWRGFCISLMMDGVTWQGKQGWPPGTESNPGSSACKEVGASVQKPATWLNLGEDYPRAPRERVNLPIPVRTWPGPQVGCTGYLTYTIVRQYILAVLHPVGGTVVPIPVGGRFQDPLRYQNLWMIRSLL